ncbi:MAG: DUF1615 family protein [Candidatus Woesearchaeota archaeon]|jgi:hypothetical protein
MAALNVVYADEAEDLFYSDPSSETFQEYAVSNQVNAEDLILVSEPTPEDFQILSLEEQAKYLLYDEGYSTEFAESFVNSVNFGEATESQIAVAEKFFTEYSDNINNNPAQFQSYLYNTEGIVLEILPGKGVTSYSSDGLLQATNGEINIKDFGDDFSYRITESGELVLWAHDQYECRFRGNIRQNDKGGIMLMGTGSFNGFKTNNVYNLKIDSQGNIQGIAQKFGDLEFVTENPGFFTYNPTTKRYTVKEAYLIEFPDVPITGTIGVEQGTNNLFVGKGDKVSVGEITVKCEEAKYVYLRFNSEPEQKYNYDPEKIIPVSATNVNEVIFNNDGTIEYYSAERSMKQGKGGGYSININAQDMLIYAESFEGGSPYVGYFNVPSEGYSLGQESSSISQVQQYLHITQSNIYDEATQAGVRQWQKEYNQRNPNTPIREDGVFDRQTRDLFLQDVGSENIVIRPRGSTGVIYNDPGALSVDNTGPVEVNIDEGQIVYNGEEIKGTVSTLEPGLPLNVRIYSEETENLLIYFSRDNSETICTNNPEQGVENTFVVVTDTDSEYVAVASMSQGEEVSSEYDGELIYAEQSIPYVPEEIRGDLHATLAYFSVPDAERWGDAISIAADQFVEEFDLPEGYDVYLERYIASEITQETNFGESIKYLEEFLADLTPSQLFVDTKGYVQIDPERAIEAANEVGVTPPFEVGGADKENTPEIFDVPLTVEGLTKYNEATPILHTPEGAALAGGRYIALLVNQYVFEQGLNPDDPESIQLVASAYNAGRYTPRNAQIQQMLNDLEYRDASGQVLKPDGSLGSNSKEVLRRYAQDRGIDSETITAELTDTSRDAFDSSTIYTSLVQDWVETTGSPPVYARVPLVSSRAQTAGQYAESVSNIYQRFTEQ